MLEGSNKREAVTIRHLDFSHRLGAIAESLAIASLQKITRKYRLSFF